MLHDWPAGRRIAMSALFTFCSAILIVTVIGGLSEMYAVRMMQIVACVLAGIVVLAAIMVVVTGRLADYTSPEDEAEQYRAALEEAFTFRVNWDGQEATPTFTGLDA